MSILTQDRLLRQFTIVVPGPLCVCSERVTRVLLMMADEQREMSVMENGNIAVAVGMKNVSSNSTPPHFSLSLTSSLSLPPPPPLYHTPLRRTRETP